VQEAILAVQAGDLETLRRIPGFATPQDDRGWLLRIAVDLQRPDLLRALLELGLDPDARVSVDALDSWGMPLYACVRGRDHVMAEILLLHGADPNGRVYASGTPLSEAYGQRDERMIALLRLHGRVFSPQGPGAGTACRPRR
jgi:ankyrin repeat protein